MVNPKSLQLFLFLSFQGIQLFHMCIILHFVTLCFTHTHWFYNVLHTHIHKYSMTLIPTPFLLHTHFVTPARPHNTNTVTLHSQIHHNQHFTFGQRLFTCPHATACEPTRHHCLGVWLIWDDLSLQISILPVTRHLRCPQVVDRE